MTESSGLGGLPAYYATLTDDALVAECAAGSGAFDPAIWEALQREIRRRGLKTRARRLTRRAAWVREVRDRRPRMSPGFQVAAPLALATMVLTLAYIVAHPISGRLPLIVPLCFGAIVLFGVGLPIDLFLNRRRKEPTEASHSDAP